MFYLEAKDLGIFAFIQPMSDSVTKMKLLVLNPNTSSIVTEKVAGVIRRIAHADTEYVVRQIAHGPEALESYYDESIAAPYILEAVKEANQQGFDALILAAFCDPVLEAVKEISNIPVYGIEEASFSTALLLGDKFGILTEKKQKEAVKIQHVRKHGLLERFAGVRALNLGVVEIGNNPAKVKEIGITICRKLVEEDKAEVIILGCASMAGYDRDIEQAVGVPVLDPVAVTFKLVEGLTSLGVHHSKIGVFALPSPSKMY
jgi:allantoin racemase